MELPKKNCKNIWAVKSSMMYTDIFPWLRILTSNASFIVLSCFTECLEFFSKRKLQSAAASSIAAKKRREMTSSTDAYPTTSLGTSTTALFPLTTTVLVSNPPTMSARVPIHFTASSTNLRTTAMSSDYTTLLPTLPVTSNTTVPTSTITTTSVFNIAPVSCVFHNDHYDLYKHNFWYDTCH